MEVFQDKLVRLKRKQEAITQACQSVCANGESTQAALGKLNTLVNWKQSYLKIRTLMEGLENELAKLNVTIRKNDLERSHLINDLSSIDYCLLCGTELKPGQAKDHLEKVGVGNVL